MDQSPSTAPAANPPIQWDDSAVHNVHYPNFCNVDHSDRDFTLLFGNGQRSAAGEGAMNVKLQDRVVLRPLAAKLLSTLLGNAVSKFEGRYGVLGDAYQPLPGSAKLGESLQPLLNAAALPEKGRLLLDLIARLNIPHESERSVKLLPGVALTERFLLGLHQSHLTPQARTRLPVICKRLGMPEPFLAEFNAGLTSAKFIHFGFEQNESSAIYKVYLESNAAPALSAAPGNQKPFELYRGFKWDAANPAEHAITRYIAHPGMSPAEMDGRLADFAAGIELDLSRAVLGLASERIEARRLLFVEAVEENNPRRSFDLNLYGAKLEVAELYPYLRQFARDRGISGEVFNTAYESHKHRTFGHISAGSDRHGRGFVTIYFGGQLA
jgi:hypothetical protein